MVAALILAAGVSLTENATVAIDSISRIEIIKRLIMVFRQASIRRIVVLTGHDAEEIENRCSHLGVVFIRNAENKNGNMLSDIKIGLTYLKGKCEKVFISPADVSLFSAETVIKLGNSQAQAAIPIYNDRSGYPLLIVQDIFDRIIGCEGAEDIDEALSVGEIKRQDIEVPDAGVKIDVSDNADMEAIVHYHSLRKIRPEAKIQLMAERGFFGPGIMLLLTLIKETGSLKHAAKRMGLSQNKAIRMIAVAEEQLGYEILATSRGGYHGNGTVGGGSSEITKKGMDLMNSYEAFEFECTEYIKRSFEKHFSGINEDYEGQTDKQT